MTARQSTQSCNTCRYYDRRQSDPDNGFCRAVPPEPKGHAYQVAWPVVAADDWCGKWEPTKEAMFNPDEPLDDWARRHGLSQRAVNLAYKHGELATIGDLLRWPIWDLRKLPQVGTRTINELSDALRPYGKELLGVNDA